MCLQHCWSTDKQKETNTETLQQCHCHHSITITTPLIFTFGFLAITEDKALRTTTPAAAS